MKAICSVVTEEAEMIRSASFSRSGESRTTMNSPLPGGEVEVSGEARFNGRERKDGRKA